MPDPAHGRRAPAGGGRHNFNDLSEEIIETLGEELGQQTPKEAARNVAKWLRRKGVKSPSFAAPFMVALKAGIRALPASNRNKAFLEGVAQGVEDRLRIEMERLEEHGDAPAHDAAHAPHAPAPRTPTPDEVADQSDLYGFIATQVDANRTRLIEILVGIERVDPAAVAFFEKAAHHPGFLARFARRVNGIRHPDPDVEWTLLERALQQLIRETGEAMEKARAEKAMQPGEKFVKDLAHRFDGVSKAAKAALKTADHVAKDAIAAMGLPPVAQPQPHNHLAAPLSIGETWQQARNRFNQ